MREIEKFEDLAIISIQMAPKVKKSLYRNQEIWFLTEIYKHQFCSSMFVASIVIVLFFRVNEFYTNVPFTFYVVST